MLKNFKFNWVCFLFPLFCLSGQADAGFSPLTERAIEKFELLNAELGYYGGYLNAKLLACSYFQDELLAYLHNAETVEEYHKGMERIEKCSKGFKGICRYSTTIFNFYTGQLESPNPHQVSVTLHDNVQQGFLNTFKTGSHLTSEERELFFNQEMSHYLQDCIAKPFLLDESTLDDLKEMVIYNFALHPDGTIYAALENPGESEYHVRNDETVIEPFHYPNHTILAGHPDQVLMTAGSLIFYRVNDKRLFFISSKSGHFQPLYDSLELMQQRLHELGINPYTIIYVPDVDLSRFVIKLYNGAIIPIAIEKRDAERLFQLALKRWQPVYQAIDRDFLRSLAQGDMTVLNPEMAKVIREQREASTYLRSAYRLFSISHQAPELIERFVKHFGKLKSGLNHNNEDKIRSEATTVLKLMDQYDAYGDRDFIPSDDGSLNAFLINNVTYMQDLLARDRLSLHEYHDLKKLSREMGSLFMYMAEDVKWRGKGFFINQSATKSFFQINTLMCKSSEAYRSQLNDDDPYVRLPPQVSRRLACYLNHLDIPPPHFPLTIDQKEAAGVINWAKRDWYTADYRSRQQAVIDFLSAIEFDDYNPHHPDFIEALDCLKWEKRTAEAARNTMVFLDAAHEVPEEIHHYIAILKRFIDGVEEGQARQLHEEASFLLARKWPLGYLQKWRCTDQDSFNKILHSHLDHLRVFDGSTSSVSKSEAENIQEHLQAFRDLIHYYRRIGAQHIPIITMTGIVLLEEHADALLNELKLGIHEDGDVILTPEMTMRATCILSKIDC